MVEYGVIQFFDIRRGTVGGQWGFIKLTDESGNRIPGRIFFRRNGFSQVESDMGTCSVEFGNKLRGRQASRQPTEGSFVVFERDEDSSGRSYACSWSLRDIWDAKEAELTAERELNWRIVLKGYEPTGIIHFAGTVDETGREDILDVVLRGTRQGSLKEARRWTAAELGFYEGQFDDYKAQGHDSYTYYLQIKQPNGKWLKLKSIDPLPEPDEPDDWPDDSDDEIDADSLAEIQHGIAHEMYNS